MSNVPTFGAQREAWSRPPVDDVGYVSSTEMLTWSDEHLQDTMRAMELVRYTGWRNHENLWRAGLSLDRTYLKNVLDYGCGTGLEAVQYAYAPFANYVTVADIVEDNVRLAQRVVALLTSRKAAGVVLRSSPALVVDESQFRPGSFDVVHCAGVLHHVMNPTVVVAAMHLWLRPQGELRLMLYSDHGWRLATGTEPPEYVVDHPTRELFVRYFDEVGDWADWYDADKLRRLFGAWFDLREFAYITPDRRYCTAVMTRRG